MSVSTAVNLSWTNLLSKKGRTLLTSIAGSIGIIGIVVVPRTLQRRSAATSRGSRKTPFRNIPSPSTNKI